MNKRRRSTLVENEVPEPAVTGNDDDHSSIQVIARAAAILRTLEEEEQGLSLGQIASKVNLPRSTVQRIVRALDAEKLLIAPSSASGIRLGPAVLRLARSVNIGSSDVIRPFLAALSAELKETVDLSVPKRKQALFIDQVIGSQRLRTVSAVGETFPLHCTANGKAFLAQFEDGEILCRVGDSYEARTPNSHTRFKTLREDISQIRRKGYALDLEEHALGICAVGVLLHDLLGDSLMISVPVPAARFHNRLKTIVERLLATKAKLQIQLGTEASLD